MFNFFITLKFLGLIDWCSEIQKSYSVVEFQLVALGFKVFYANHSLVEFADKFFQTCFLRLEISALYLGIRHLLDCFNLVVSTLKSVKLVANGH